MLPLRPHSARSAGEAPELRHMKTTTTRNLALQCNFPRQLSIEYENYNNAVIYIYCRLFFLLCVSFFFSSFFSRTVICNFRSPICQALILEIGETVQILEKSEGNGNTESFCLFVWK